MQSMNNSPCEDLEDYQGSELRYANTLGLLWTTEQSKLATAT